MVPEQESQVNNCTPKAWTTMGGVPC
uniref:Uncharacterized protein n=1 Tax=Rhizophora mucronata TaxID=61149 RepID=A0A2P2L1K5_RHIMU